MLPWWCNRLEKKGGGGHKLTNYIGDVYMWRGVQSAEDVCCRSVIRPVSSGRSVVEPRDGRHSPRGQPIGTDRRRPAISQFGVRDRHNGRLTLRDRR